MTDSSSSATTATLLLIDAQNDFHPPSGSLAIPTALDDAQRIADLLKARASDIHRVVATMDTHTQLHIAHPGFWISGDSSEGSWQHPSPFTIITSQQVQDGVWKPRPDLDLTTLESSIDQTVFTDTSVWNDDGSLDIRAYCIAYTQQLEAKGRFQLCIWPEHCLWGTTGHAVVPVIQDALQEWTRSTGRSVEYLCKGTHGLTEMYSAVRAEVPVSATTAKNPALMQQLVWTPPTSSNGHEIWVCGQAMSHCVNFTLRDVVEEWQATSAAENIARVKLLTDGASAVTGFTQAADDFQADMKAAGVQLCTIADLMPK